MNEIETLRTRLKNSMLPEIKQEELINYFKPIYYVEFEEIPLGELFPVVSKIGFYDKLNNKKQAVECFETNGAKRVIEKSMITGKEKVLMG